MNKKLSLPLMLLLVLSMLLSACGGGAAPVVDEPVVEAPTEAPVVITEEPVALDLAPLFADFWATVPPDKGYGTVAAPALNEELATAAPFLLDVREPSELEADGYIDGTVNIPIRSLLENLDKLPGLDDPIVIYCKSGHRGAFGQMALKMMGYTNVRNLGGGIGAWKKAEFPVVMGMPAAPEAISTPIVENEALYNVLNDFLVNLPEGFYSVKTDGLATELAENPPFVVDVRSQGEWDKEGYIEGATLIEFPTFLDNLDKLPADKDARIVIYCKSGHRGALAAMALHLTGYTNVVNLGGGFGAWKSAGLPVAGWVDWPVVFGEFVASLPADQGFYSVSAAKLNEMMAETPPFLVDVREPAELADSGFIAGAINLPVRDFLKNLDKLPAQDQKIVIYCGSGHRGALAMVALRMLGYTDVVNLGGGIGAWKKGEFALETGTPAEPVAGTAPEVDPTRFAALDAYLSNLPEGFGGTKPASVNELIVANTAPVILDVRSQKEWDEDGYIDGALKITINDLPAALDQLPTDKATPIVTVCKSGHRGAIAQMYLQFLGYTDVKNLGGGMGAWVAAELPVVK